MRKRMLSLLLALVMVVSLMPTTALAGDIIADRRGWAKITIENTTFTEASALSNNQPPAWKGEVPGGFPVTEGMTMMDAIVKFLKDRNISQTGAESGYISEIGGLKAFDNGPESGWMGTLNDWFTSKGFDNYVIQPGDTIKIMYTSNGLGADLGGDWNSSDKRLRDIELTTSKYSEDLPHLVPAFSPDNHEYSIVYAETYEGSAKGNTIFRPLAVNQQYQVHTFVGEQEILPADTLHLTGGMEIVATCGDPAWDTASDNSAPAEVYTFHVVRPGTLLNAENVSIKSIKGDPSVEGADVTLKYDAEWAKFTGKFAPFAQTPDFNDAGFTVTLSDLPADVTAELTAADGSKIADFVDGVATVESGIEAADDYVYCIKVTQNDVTDYYELKLTKPTYYLSSLKLSGIPEYSAANIFNGQPEGTLFQADENGEPTGEVGYARGKCWNYAIYVSPAVKQIGMPSKTSINMTSAFSKEFTLGVNVNGEEYVAQQEKGNAQTEFFSKPISLDSELTVIDFCAKQKADPRFVLSTKVFVHVVKVPVAELVENINAVDVDALIYPDDVALIQSYQIAYDNYTEEEKAQVPEDTVQKLAAATAKLAELQARFEGGIQEMTDLVNSCVTEINKENYTDYLDTVRKATDKFLSLSDAQRAQLSTVKCASGVTVTQGYWDIYNIAILQSIADGISLGYPTDYPDDFIIQSGYYNLDLGHEDTYYQTGFREIWTNRPETYYNYGEKGLPFTSPGLLEFDIKDESIFGIKEVESVYVDKGLSGKGEHPNMLYYLVPKKAGTTTFTVKLCDEKGVMYCQTPEIVVHVNSPEESATEKLYQKLTNFTELEYTRRYDNWCYQYGDEGAEFTFHVNGDNGKVWVYNYLEYNEDGTPVKTEYKVQDNGDVTILLKDGYNCIEVNADYDGKNVTQVYSLKGKVVKQVVENITRPGEALRTGDAAGVWTIGRPICLHKISRIYNNGNGSELYITDMPRQGLVRADEHIKIGYKNFNGAGEAGWISRLYVDLTDSGTVTLHDGYIMHAGYGSGLGSELTQGNTGEMADSTTFEFGHLADITLDVAENPNYVPPTDTMATVASNGGKVRAGESITITVPDLPTGDMQKTYEVDKTQELKYAISGFYTDIPGLRSVNTSFKKYSRTDDDVQSVHEIKAITFTVPADTAPGTYNIHGGNVAICYTKSYMDAYDWLYRGEIDDITITVLPADWVEPEPITPVGPSKPSKPTEPTEPSEPVTPAAPTFNDVTESDWYYDGVKYACDNGLMNGTGEGTFAPKADTTRGMIVTILARMEGVNTSGGASWYALGSEWAMNAGVSDGTNMEGKITREQLAVMLYRYAKMKGYDVSASADISAYTDASGVSGWAKEAMQWAVGSGLIQGSGSALAPQANADRAQIATILMRFAQSIAK